jgi:uncharacterized protein (DUF1778 family)
MPSSAGRKEKLRIRFSRKAKQALLAAAGASHQSLSAFVLDSALAHAGKVLANRRNFGPGEEQWKAFLAALDAPPRPLPRLERLLTEPGFFDSEH